MIDLLVPTTAQGLLWAVMALGVYITYRVLDVADLTVEGSFPLGAAVAASMLAAGFGPIPSFIGAAVAGAAKKKPCAMMTALTINGNLQLSICSVGNEEDEKMLENFFDSLAEKIKELAEY